MTHNVEIDQELAAGRSYLLLLRRLVVNLQQATDQLVRPHGLTGPQFLVLGLVGNNDGLSQSDLVRLTESDANTVSAVVRRLTERGLLTREPDPNDRRAVRLHLTGDGRELVIAGLKDVDELSRQLARAMPKRHSKAITEWLTAVIDHAKEAVDA